VQAVEEVADSAEQTRGIGSAMRKRSAPAAAAYGGAGAGSVPPPPAAAPASPAMHAPSVSRAPGGVPRPKANRGPSGPAQNPLQDAEQMIAKEDAGASRRWKSTLDEDMSGDSGFDIVLPCTVLEFAQASGVKTSIIIAKLLMAGVMANSNSVLERDAVELLAAEFRKSVRISETIPPRDPVADAATLRALLDIVAKDGIRLALALRAEATREAWQHLREALDHHGHTALRERLDALRTAIDAHGIKPAQVAAVWPELRTLLDAVAQLPPSAGPLGPTGPSGPAPVSKPGRRDGKFWG